MAAVPVVSFYAKVKPGALEAVQGMLRLNCQGDESPVQLTEILLRSAISAADRNAAASGASGAAREANRVTGVQDHKERLLSASTRAKLQECRLQTDSLGRHTLISEEGLTDTVSLNVDNLAKPRTSADPKAAALRCLRGFRVTRSAVNATVSPVAFLNFLRFEPVLRVERKGLLFTHAHATILLCEERRVDAAEEGAHEGTQEQEQEQEQPSAKRARAGAPTGAPAGGGDWVLEVRVSGEAEQEESRALWAALFKDADEWADALLPHATLEPFRVRQVLAMLQALGGREDALMATRLLLPQLEYLKQDPWWEVQAQLLRLCCALLVRRPRQLHEGGGGEHSDGGREREREALIWSQLLDALLVLLQSRAPAQQCFVLCESAPLLKLPELFPELGAPFVRCLLSLPPTERAAILSTDPKRETPIPGAATAMAAGCESTLTPLPLRWHALTVARELMAVAKTQKLWDPKSDGQGDGSLGGTSAADQRAEAAMRLAATRRLEQLKALHADVLLAVLSTDLDGAERDGWRAWLFEHTIEGKDYLFPWLCDPKFSRPLGAKLAELFGFLRQGWADHFARRSVGDAHASASDKADSALQRCFAKLFAKVNTLFQESEGHAACQASVRTLLDELLAMGSPYTEAIRANVVGDFDLKVSQQARNALGDFIARVEKST